MTMDARHSPLRYNDKDEMAVVVGLAVDSGGMVLMPLRFSDVARPSMYELPGGKVELHETHEDALKREFLEELGVAIKVIGPCLSSVKFRLETDFTIYLYPVELQGVAHAIRFRRSAWHLRWLDPKYAIQNVPCVPSTYSFYRDIRKWVHYYINRDKHGLPWFKWCQYIHYTTERLTLPPYAYTSDAIEKYLRMPKE